MQFPENILEREDKLVNGVEIGCSTLLGVNTSKFPVSRGNCFSMKADNGKSYRVVNFYLENLEEGIRRGKLTLPVRLYILGDPSTGGSAVIYDTRIPEGWYNDEFCPSCTPYEFQSFTQRMRRQLKIESGRLKVTKYDGREMCVETIGDKAGDWRLDSEKNPIVYANYRTQVGPIISMMGDEVHALMMEALEAEIAEEKKEVSNV